MNENYNEMGFAMKFNLKIYFIYCTNKMDGPIHCDPCV